MTDRSGVPVPLLHPWIRWGGVAAVAAFVFYTSIVTAPPETVLDEGAWAVDPLELDKWRHFLAYATFGGTLAYATADWDADRHVLAAGVVGVAVLYGVGIEVGQSFLPARQFSLGDAYASAVGGLLVIPWYLVRPYVSLVPVGDLRST